MDFFSGVDLGVDFFIGVNLGVDFFSGVDLGVDFFIGVNLEVDFLRGVDLGCGEGVVDVKYFFIFKFFFVRCVNGRLGVRLDIFENGVFLRFRDFVIDNISFFEIIFLFKVFFVFFSFCRFLKVNFLDLLSIFRSFAL